MDCYVNKSRVDAVKQVKFLQDRVEKLEKKVEQIQSIAQQK